MHQPAASPGTDETDREDLLMVHAYVPVNNMAGSQHQAPLTTNYPTNNNYGYQPGNENMQFSQVSAPAGYGFQDESTFATTDNDIQLWSAPGMQTIDLSSLPKYTCLDCGEQVSNQRGFATHLIEIHNIKQPFPCDKCGQSFTRMDNRKAHQKRNKCRHHS